MLSTTTISIPRLKLYLPSVDLIFEHNLELLSSLRNALDLNSKDGSLVLISGKTSSGKTLTAHALILDLLNRKLSDDFRVTCIGYSDLEINNLNTKNFQFISSDNAKFMMGLGEKYLLNHFTDQIIFIDEIRTEVLGYVAVVFAKAGRKVITTFHSPEEQFTLPRYQALLLKAQTDQTVLKAASMDDIKSIFVVHQNFPNRTE